MEKSHNKYNMNNGLCECGCGFSAPIATTSQPSVGLKKGEARRFLKGHSNRGSGNNNWRGGRTITKYGYAYIRKNGKAVREHLMIAEKALGKKLPLKAVVHHLDCDRSNNKNSNLVICQDESYHGLLHRRTRAFNATGKTSSLKCCICKRWDNPENLYIFPDGKTARHRECHNNYLRNNKIIKQIKPL